MGHIFNNYSLREYINSNKKELAEEIDRLEITNSTNTPQLVERFKTKYLLEPLVLKDAIPTKPIETERNRKNHLDQKYVQKVFEINVTIPFTGNRVLFDCCPSESTLVHLDESIKINSRNINTTITIEELDHNKFNAQLEKTISDLSRNIPKVNSEIEPWNNGLENYIKQLIEQRKEVVSKKFDFMEKIGLRINPKSDEFIIPSPITKKVIPVPVTETSKTVNKEIIPILQEKVYDDIKEVLYNVGNAISRKPSLYKEKQEPDLRDIFLLFLETRYDSTAGVGEAFNKKGKTDILLKYAPDGSNIFIAECKFWTGPKDFLKTIDQLFGYVTHRDTKTALLFFVDQKNITTIVEKIIEEASKHSAFKKHIKNTYDTSLSFEFLLPDDSQKIIQMEIMFFHFPSI